LNFYETEEKFEKLFLNKMDEDEARELLVSLYQRGENFEEIAAAAKVMRKYSIKLELDENTVSNLIDVVGTGGDKSGSFNVSSTVSLLLASQGCVVAKHGNRAITSNSGSADMLETLGINLNLNTHQQAKMLMECGFTFMFAQNHHLAMKHIMPIRKSLPHRTIFNILGPLTNPAEAKKYLLGVFDKAYIENIAKALVRLESKKAFIVSSNDFMDEISVSDVTHFAKIDKKEISYGVIDPSEYGIKLSSFLEIKGGDAKVNANITMDIIKGLEKGAKRDITLINSAFALVANESARDIQEGLEMSKDAIDSHKTALHLKKIIEISNKL
jgi:anthranilate phosphoribosyltransferase